MNRHRRSSYHELLAQKGLLGVHGLAGLPRHGRVAGSHDSLQLALCLLSNALAGAGASLCLLDLHLQALHLHTQCVHLHVACTQASAKAAQAFQLLANISAFH